MVDTVKAPLSQTCSQFGYHEIGEPTRRVCAKPIPGVLPIVEEKRGGFVRFVSLLEINRALTPS